MTAAGISFLSEGQGAPIVFLHGIGGGARQFAGQLRHFGRTARAVAWDMPGYGGSAPLSTVTIASLAEALARFLAALGLERPVLVGHSIGGMIVQQLLADAPLAARAVVLAQTSAAFGGRDPAWAAEFIRARLAPLEAGRTLAELAPEMVAAMIGEAPDLAGMALARDCIAATPEAAYRATVEAMPGFDLRHALPRIAVPTLVLAGTRDPNAPAEAMERMAGRIPGARFVALEGAGHLAHLEQPERFDAALGGFLAELDA